MHGKIVGPWLSAKTSLQAEYLTEKIKKHLTKDMTIKEREPWG